MTYLPRLPPSLLSLTLLPAHAQPKILPGLWEFSSGDIVSMASRCPVWTRCWSRCRTCRRTSGG